jgi:hypothetical protein
MRPVSAREEKHVMDRVPICTQERCALRAAGVGPERVAELALACLSGRELEDVVEGGEPILPRRVCLDCIHRVMHERAPLPTRAQVDRAAAAGRASRRRQRRRRASG